MSGTLIVFLNAITRPMPSAANIETSQIAMPWLRSAKSRPATYFQLTAAAASRRTNWIPVFMITSS